MESTDAKKPVVFAMMADPEPNKILTIFNGRGAIMNPDANRPKPSDLLEAERRVSWIAFKQFVILISQLLDLFRQLVVKFPEFLAGPVLHKSVQRPSRLSRNASLASASSRPLLASSSNCLSQASASKSSNQARKAESSTRVSLLTADSISGTVLINLIYSLKSSG